jgi:hypothetical protein
MILVSSLAEIEDAAKVDASEKELRVLHKLLFANVVAALETFLGDLFLKTLASNEKFLQDFVQKTGHFQATKICMSEIFIRIKKIEQEVRTFVISHNWHRLDDSAHMYKRAFSISFPDISPEIKDGIKDRHDIVHRNGKTSDGVEGAWNFEKIHSLKHAVLLFSTELNDRITRLMSDASPF